MMKANLRLISGILGFMTLSAVVAGCLSTAVPGGSSSSGITNPIPTPTATGSNGFQFSGSDFFVNVASPPGTTMLLHEDGDWTKPCKVTTSQDALGIDEFCVLEANELDLYYNGTTLDWQGPSQQCTYVRMNPYSYFQFEPGIGPTQVSATTINGGPPEITSHSGGTTYPIVDKNGQITCATDYSSLSPIAGPNCCEGQYQLTLTEVTTGEPNTVTTETADWGGKVSNCLAGPGADSQVKDAYGDLEPSYYFTENGTLNQSYPVKAPIQKGYISNGYVANYFCPGGSSYCPGQAGITPVTTGASIAPGSYNAQNAPSAMQFQPSFAYTGDTTSGTNTITGLTNVVVSTTGDDTASSPVLTNLTSTSGLVPGMYVTGTGIPAWTQVVSVDAASSAVTISAEASSSNAGTALSFQLINPNAGAVSTYVFGPGIPTGTTVTSETANTITLSQNATASLTGATFTLAADLGQISQTGQWLEGQPYYEWDCLDSAQDYVARIRVLVRSWTTTTALQSAYGAATEGSTGNPFVCGPETNYPDQPLYDRLIWPQCTSSGTTFGFGDSYPGNWI